jgi:site-specific recombinase XerD
MRMREKGLKATGCNCALRAINAYLRWSGSPLKVPALKEPQLILPTFTTSQVSRLVAWKPKDFYQTRLHLLTLLLLDTGCRHHALLAPLAVQRDQQIIQVNVPDAEIECLRDSFSFELRKGLFRYIREYGRKPDWLLLATRAETMLNRRDTLREVKRLCKRLGFDPPVRTLHAFRHTFGVNYIRRGGSVFHLQKVLGHSTLEMTRRYANLMTEDLQAVHERVSLLSMR